MASAAEATAEAAARRSYGKLVAFLAARTNGLAAMRERDADNANKKSPGFAVGAFRSESVQGDVDGYYRRDLCQSGRPPRSGTSLASMTLIPMSLSMA